MLLQFLGDIGAQFLADGLCDNISVLKLNLGCNEIKDAGTASLARGISRNSTLEARLSHDSNYFSILYICSNNI